MRARTLCWPRGAPRAILSLWRTGGRTAASSRGEAPSRRPRTSARRARPRRALAAAAGPTAWLPRRAAPGDLSQIKAHPFFAGVDFAALPDAKPPDLRGGAVAPAPDAAWARRRNPSWSPMPQRCAGRGYGLAVQDGRARVPGRGRRKRGALGGPARSSCATTRPRRGRLPRRRGQLPHGSRTRRAGTRVRSGPCGWARSPRKSLASPDARGSSLRAGWARSRRGRRLGARPGRPGRSAGARAARPTAEVRGGVRSREGSAVVCAQGQQGLHRLCGVTRRPRARGRGLLRVRNRL